MQTDRLLCFGARPGSGNAALVVEGAPQDGETRQAISAASGAGACAFIDDGVIDFYYPHARSVLCLHASLAAAAVLFARAPQAEALTVRTAQRGQVLRLERGAVPGQYAIELAGQPAPSPAIDLAQVGALLRTTPAAIAAKPAVASVGSPKLLVEVTDAATLHALAPDLAAILAWGKAQGVNGIYAYCRMGEGQFEGRNFNHADPAHEDSATGVAAGALALHLGQALEVRQGAATGQDCLLRAAPSPGGVTVGGATERM
jgi:PhzF family phenazine biosynthesis protein